MENREAGEAAPTTAEASMDRGHEVVSKSDLLHFVERTNSRYENYHGRKETASWVALALYVAISLQVAGFEGERMRVLLSLWQTAIALTFLVYIRAQIGSRNFASFVASACSEIEVLLLAEKGETLSRSNYPLDLATDGKRQADYLLPGFLRAKAQAFRCKGGAPGRVMDFSRYTIFAMSTLLAFVGIWAA